MSIQDMSDCLDAIGMESAAVKVNLDQLKTMPLPAILYWQQRHFVVLYKISKKFDKYYIADPAQGKIKYSEADFREYWIAKGDNSGLAVLGEPGEEFQRKEYPQDRSYRNFFNYIKRFYSRHKRRFLCALFVSILIMVADIATPFLLCRTIDDGIGNKDISLIAVLLLCQLSISIGTIVSSGLVEIVLAKIGLQLHLEMVSEVFSKLSKFPLSFFDRKISSDFVQKVNDQTRIRDFLVSAPNTFFFMALTLIVFSVLLFHFSPLIFLVFIFLSVLEIFWNILFLNQKKTLDYKHFTKSSENYMHAHELTNGMADLKVNNAESVRTNKWISTQKILNDISLKTSWLKLVQGGGHSFLTRFKELFVTGIGSAMVIYGDLSFGALMTLGYITGRLSQPFTTIASSISSCQEALLSFQRVEDIVNNNQEIRGEKGFTGCNITFKNVWFKYPGAGSPFVIKNLNLEMLPGKVTALVGESGSGKSTLIKLMLGFYEPQKGSLKLGEEMIQDVNNAEWLKHCGVVMQETRIFTGSLLENIAMTEEKPDIERVNRILEIAELKDFVQSLPMGLDTIIGVTGIEMSGGQKQRLMIARALYKNPDMLLLDEATSSLDANNEKNIIHNLQKYAKGKTVVIAAHRLSTVKNADRILFIKDGEIIEDGTHDELISMKGHYWNLVRNQLQLSV